MSRKPIRILYFDRMLSLSRSLDSATLPSEVSHHGHESEDELIAPDGGHGTNTQYENDVQREV